MRLKQNSESYYISGETNRLTCTKRKRRAPRLTSQPGQTNVIVQHMMSNFHLDDIYALSPLILLAS